MAKRQTKAGKARDNHYSALMQRTLSTAGAVVNIMDFAAMRVEWDKLVAEGQSDDDAAVAVVGKFRAN